VKDYHYKRGLRGDNGRKKGRLLELGQKIRNFWFSYKLGRKSVEDWRVLQKSRDVWCSLGLD